MCCRAAPSRALTSARLTGVKHSGSTPSAASQSLCGVAVTPTSKALPLSSDGRECLKNEGKDTFLFFSSFLRFRQSWPSNEEVRDEAQICLSCAPHALGFHRCASAKSKY